MPAGYRKDPGPLLPDRMRHDGSIRRIGRAGSPSPGSWQAGSDAPAARESPANDPRLAGLATKRGCSGAHHRRWAPGCHDRRDVRGISDGEESL